MFDKIIKHIVFWLLFPGFPVHRILIIWIILRVYPNGLSWFFVTLNDPKQLAQALSEKLKKNNNKKTTAAPSMGKLKSTHQFVKRISFISF